MKWLFAILVVLNIVVFGSMVAGKLARDQVKNATDQTSMTTTMPLTEPLASPNISVESASGSRSVPEVKEATKPARIAQASQPADNNKDNDKSKNDNVLNAAPSRTCTATVSLPEDDFHRIKGLFNQWPYTTSRFVEKLNTPPRAARQSPTRYAVTLPNTNDSDLRTRLQSQGFDYGIVQGQVSLGVFNHRGDAESLLARAKMHGFSDAAVTNLNNNDRDDADNSATSVAKIRVVFTGMNKAAIQDVNNVVGRYGQLQQNGVCQ